MINYECSPVNCLDSGKVNCVKNDINIVPLKSGEKSVDRPLWGLSTGRVLVRQREQLHQPDGPHHQVLRRAVSLKVQLKTAPLSGWRAGLLRIRGVQRLPTGPLIRLISFASFSPRKSLQCTDAAIYFWRLLAA